MNPYIQLSTGVLTDHRLITPDAFTVYVRGLLYSKVHQTDGFIPADAITFVTVGVTRDVTLLVTQLVTNGLWKECEGGYTVGAEKWSKYQETKEDDEKRRASARDRQRIKRQRDAEKLAQFLEQQKQASNDNVTRDSCVTHDEVTVQRREEKRREDTKDIIKPVLPKAKKVFSGDREIPTLEQVREHAKEIGMPQSAADDCFFWYDEREWVRVSNGRQIPITKWKSTVSGWHSRNLSKLKQNGTAPPKLSIEEARRINEGDLPDLGSPVKKNA